MGHRRRDRPHQSGPASGCVGRYSAWRRGDRGLAIRRQPVDGEPRAEVAGLCTTMISARPSPSDPRGGGRVSSKTSVSGRVMRPGCIGKASSWAARVPASTVAEDAMGVAGGRILEPRVRRCRRTATCPSIAAPIQGGCRRRRRPLPRPATGRTPATRRGRTLRKARQGTRRHRDAAQICFSGICTTSPSSASETLSWQVRRERSVSGS
jgi:hypothetical protein